MSEEFEYDRFAKLKDKPFQKAMLVLAEGAMAFGEGMTKAPYYSNYLEQDRDKAKMAYETWKQKQALNAYTNAAGQTGTVPTVKVPDPSSPIGFRTEIDPTYKGQMESEQKANETMVKEESEYKSSKALLKSIKEDWLKTNPTRLTNNGKFSPLGSFWKAPLQPGYMAEQWLGSKIGATRNQRADAVYIRRINALQSRLAKGVIGKDTGNLNYQEQIAAKGGVAGIGDPYEVGLDLFDRTEKMLDEMLEARKQGFKNITEKWKDFLSRSRNRTKRYQQQNHSSYDKTFNQGYEDFDLFENED